MHGGLIGGRVFNPALDGGCAPSRAAGADLDALGERACFHFPVKGRAREACQRQHRLEPKNAISSGGLHRDHLASSEGLMIVLLAALHPRSLMGES